MKHTLPKELPIGSKVIDSDGIIYTRNVPEFGYGNRTWLAADTNVYRTWAELLEKEVEDYVEPDKIGDIYTSNEDDKFNGTFKVLTENGWKYFNAVADSNSGYVEFWKAFADSDSNRKWVKA